MNICTTGNEDHKGTSLLKDALMNAYEAGLVDATKPIDSLKVISRPHSGESFTSEVEETAYQLWTKLMRALKIDV